MENLRNKVAIVTGASSGIGTAVVRMLHGRGARVAFCGRRKSRLEALADELGPNTLALGVDLRSESQILSMFRRIDDWGPVSVLVNNAGLGRDTSLSDGSTDDWREMLDVNVLALCLCTREAITRMRANKGPSYVINISSMSAHRVPLGYGFYSATKFAVRALTEGLRQELAQSDCPIRVSAISPGLVQTEFHEAHFGSKQAATETYSRFRVLDPEDIANAVAYLISTPSHVQVHDILVRPTAQAS